ncbi:Qat anti-phage system QueC-like protein QatC [Draconibacterium sediminis]|uniref:Qat anti-phage system QueC-like protein QatC n=1 Tax=Draconibacterium sediminis TaxID=1544798 RepID=UPI0026EF6854|nr:Qat anti-phage system QueC-like protein QatC [Draconibacterium sediminis]
MNKVKIDIVKPKATDKGSFANIFLSLEEDSSYRLEIDNTYFENLFRHTKETTSIAFEFYLFTVIVYNIDKLIPRKKMSLDGWTREIKFEFPVNKLSIWNHSKQRINKMLSFLTGDVWNVSFTQGNLNGIYVPSEEEDDNDFAPDKICLFSGGLDSLVGSYELLCTKKKTLLVSHYDVAMSSPSSDQHKIITQLETKFNIKSDFDWIDNRVGAKRGSSKKLETTFRSRSILFIGMASYLAHNLTPNKSFHIPENGTISLNIPLSPSRRSSCSTKTTHPHFLSSVNEIFSNLNILTKVENPHDLDTKGEMLVPFASDNFFKGLVELSNSCGKGGHTVWWFKIYHNNHFSANIDTSESHHCGKCMPCIYRRAAMHKVGWDSEKYYGDNIFNANQWGWKNESWHKRMKDVKTLLNFISLQRNQEEIKRELLINGTLPFDKLDDYSNVVVRTIDEIKNWLNDHSKDSNYQELKSRAKL